MSFDLIKYLANNPLLEVDIPKNKWVELSKQDLEDYKDDIFGLIQTTFIHSLNKRMVMYYGKVIF
jgi:hypothetical protein